MDFGDLLGTLWEAFGSILGSKSRVNFGVFFGIVFFTITGRGVALTGLRRAFGAPAAQVPVPRTPPRAAPFSRAEGSYNPQDRRIAGSQDHRIAGS